MLAALQALWERYPDQRLGQLIDNLTPKGLSTFYVEDDIMEAAIAAYPMHLKLKQPKVKEDR